MYAGRIVINNNPQKIKIGKMKSLGTEEALSITYLKSLGLNDDDKFLIFEDKNSGEYSIIYDVIRIETQKEVDLRVAKEIEYNKNYELHQVKNKK